MKKLWMSWSTGKDSAFALFKLMKSPDYEVAGLFTTVNEDHERVAMHATRLILLQRQAEELSLPLEIINIPANCSNDLYGNRMHGLIEKALDAGVSAMGFGDLYLEDVRRYREKLLCRSGIEAVFPLWKKPTAALAQEMLASGIEAVITCIDPNKLPASFAGRYFNFETLKELPADTDPCGENGEFHTFVFASPNFQNRIPVFIGKTVDRGGFVFADVLPAF